MDEGEDVDGEYDDSGKIHTLIKQDGDQYVKTFTIKDQSYFEEMLNSYILAQ